MKQTKFKSSLYTINLYLGKLENYHSYGGFGFYGVNSHNEYIYNQYSTGGGYYKPLTIEYDVNLIYGTDKIH